MAIWKPILVQHTLTLDGLPRYEVSDEGDVRIADEWSEYYGRLLKQHTLWGEPCVWLNNGSGKGVGRIHKVGELMEAAFGVPKRGRKPGSRSTTLAGSSVQLPDPRKTASRQAEKGATDKQVHRSVAESAITTFRPAPVETKSAPETAKPAHHVPPQPQKASSTLVRRQETVPVQRQESVSAHRQEPVPVHRQEPVPTQREEPVKQETFKYELSRRPAPSPAQQIKAPNESTEYVPTSVEGGGSSRLAETVKVLKGEATARDTGASEPKSAVDEVPRVVPKKTTRQSKLRKAVRQLDMDGNPIDVFASGVAAAAATGTSQSSISACCRGVVKSAGGFRWEFVE